MSLKAPARRQNSVRASKAEAISESSRQLLHAQEQERKRISRELHDGIGQGLMGLRLYLGMLAGDVQSLDSEWKVQEALKLLDHTSEELRRIIGRLSPRTLDQLGLLAAIRKEAEDLSRRTGLKARLELPEVLRLNHEVEAALYRSLQEALNNIAKHARAQNFVIRVQRMRDWVRLSVEDDGVGFSSRGAPRRGFGLLGMQERLAALGGKLRLRARGGRGASLSVSLPAPPDAINDASRTGDARRLARAGTNVRVRA